MQCFRYASAHCPAPNGALVAPVASSVVAWLWRRFPAFLGARCRFSEHSFSSIALDCAFSSLRAASCFASIAARGCGVAVRVRRSACGRFWLVAVPVSAGRSPIGGVWLRPAQFLGRASGFARRARGH